MVCSCSSKKTNFSRYSYFWLSAAVVIWVLVYRSLPAFAKWIVALMPLQNNKSLEGALEFFFYDAPKVLMLLSGVIFFMGIVNTYFQASRVKALLAGKKQFTGNILAACLGLVTPFCSCSSVPLFLGLLRAGVPLGATFSFLTAAPMVNQIAVALLFALLGWKITLLYLVFGLMIAIFSGWIVGRLGLEGYLEDWVKVGQTAACACGQVVTFSDRLAIGFQQVKMIVGRIGPYVILGIAVGAAIHGYVPEKIMVAILGKSTWWAVPAAVIVGVPLYGNIAGFMPIVQAMLLKGAALGTTLAFMMATVGLSLPEMIMLRKALKPRLLAVFVCTVAVGIVLVGYLFNAL